MLAETEIKQYIKLAYERLDLVYAPYSNFPVSAVLLTQDNQVFTGVNIENVSYGATNCAERTAIFTAVNAGYRKQDFKAMFVIANTDSVITPCSICRQVFVEHFAKEMPIYLANKKQEYIMATVEELVPYAFDNLTI